MTSLKTGIYQSNMPGTAVYAPGASVFLHNPGMCFIILEINITFFSKLSLSKRTVWLRPSLTG